MLGLRTGGLLDHVPLTRSLLFVLQSRPPAHTRKRTNPSHGSHKQDNMLLFCHIPSSYNCGTVFESTGKRWIRQAEIKVACSSNKHAPKNLPTPTIIFFYTRDISGLEQSTYVAVLKRFISLFFGHVVRLPALVSSSRQHTIRYPYHGPFLSSCFLISSVRPAVKLEAFRPCVSRGISFLQGFTHM